MASLPDYRVSTSVAFSSTGVDYLGPLLVKNIFGTDSTMYKVHVVLYTCATSRAVSLGLVPDTTCAAFVRNLKRFISRNRIPRLFISDNAKCFTGPELTTFVHQIHSEWKFILSVSPWWGGFWERLVKSVKRCLRKTIGKSKLTYEELETVIVEIEGVLNSRPLCYVYDDPSNDVLTPSHLVRGERLLSSFQDDIEPENVEFSAEALSKRGKFLNTVLNHYWDRWRREYLTELREHHNSRNRTPSKLIRLGEVVLIEEDKVPRNRWRVGVVIELYPSVDGVVRGCKVKTLTKGNKCSFIDRPVQKLYPMEILCEDLPIPTPEPTFDAEEPTMLTPPSPLISPTSNETMNEYNESTRPRRIAAVKGIEQRRLAENSE